MVLPVASEDVFIEMARIASHCRGSSCLLMEHHLSKIPPVAINIFCSSDVLLLVVLKLARTFMLEEWRDDTLTGRHQACDGRKFERNFDMAAEGFAPIVAPLVLDILEREQDVQDGYPSIHIQLAIPEEVIFQL